MSDEKKKKPRGDIATRFKPGQSGNPKGRPRVRADLKEVKLMSPVDVRRMIQKLLDMTKEELEKLVASPDCPMMELMLGRIIVQGVMHGDQSKLGFLFDRTIGKVFDNKEERQLADVTYTTNIDTDGRLVQEIIEDEDKESEDGQ